MEWLLPGALGDARIARSAIFVDVALGAATSPAYRLMRASVSHSRICASAPQRRAGFTLVELIVATAVLSVGLLAISGAGAAVVRLERQGDRLSQIAAAGETRLELLRAQGCAAMSGASDAGPFVEHWTVVSLTDVAHEVVDSITEEDTQAGAAPRTLVYRSVVRC